MNAPPTPTETIQFSRPADLPGVEIMRVENSSRLWRVFHETYTVCTVLPCDARSEWIYRGRLYSAGQRGVMLMEPGETHVNTKSKGLGRFFVLTVRAQSAERAFRELGLHSRSPHFRVNETYDRKLYETLVRFLTSLTGPSTTLERQSRYSTALRQVVEDCIEEGIPARRESLGHRAVRRVRDYIRQNHSQEITLRELAAIARISPFHLNRLFTKEIGIAPHAYQIGVRIEHARDLLARRLPPAQVAVDLGFYDQSHFTSHFKRSLGITPGQYLAHLGRPTFGVCQNRKILLDENRADSHSHGRGIDGSSDI